MHQILLGRPHHLGRARRGRAKIRELKAVRLTVHRTPRHIYAQIVALVQGIAVGSVLSALVVAVIAFYILFQVRALYKP